MLKLRCGVMPSSCMVVLSVVVGGLPYSVATLTLTHFGPHTRSHTRSRESTSFFLIYKTMQVSTTHTSIVTEC